MSDVLNELKDKTLHLLLGKVWEMLKPALESLLSNLSEKLITLIQTWVEEQSASTASGAEKKAAVLAKVGASPEFANVPTHVVNFAVEAAVARMKNRK